VIPPRLAQPVDVYRDADAAAPPSSRDRDEFGDELETPRDAVPGGSTDEPYLTAVPMWIAEQDQRIPVDDDLRLVRLLLARVAGGTDIRPGDRLRTADDQWFAVTSARQPKWSRFRLPDLRLELSRTT
jgi:hypothetical protein